jgi:DNA-3-methyladenine glycosylase II
MSAHSELAASDPVMARLVDRFGELSMETRRKRTPAIDAYGTLLRSVVGQQVSVKAAAAIYGRVAALFDDETPAPESLLEIDPQALRDAGLSWRKVEYVRDLADHVLSGELELDRLGELSDEEVIAEITAVRGLGLWSAQVFCMFFLERPDILPAGDLGIRHAVENEYGLDAIPPPKEVERIGERWSPHRTLASIYLWESLHNAPME